MTRISRSLPICIMCGRINTQGRIHTHCFDMGIEVSNIYGWSISEEQYNIFKKKKEIGIYSIYGYLLTNLLERQRINTEEYRILPIQNISIDRYLVSLVHSNIGSNKLCFIGEHIENKNYFIEKVQKSISNSTEKVVSISLFNYL
jgi:hypothetical protein